MNKFYKYDKNINGDKMKIEELMTKNIITAKKSEKVFEIAQKMKEYNIGFIPVIDNSKIIGVITDRDIVINCISNNNDKNETVENYINKNIVSVKIEDDLEQALNLMKDNKVKRLIVSDNNKVIGIISLSDILTTNLTDELLETVKSIWEIQDRNKLPDSQIDEFYL